MGARFRAVCTDIDGTLLNADRQLSPSTVAAFRGLPPGVPVILASSRMPSAMTHLQRELGIEGHPLICYNGAYIVEYNGAGHHVHFSTVIPVEVCRTIARLTPGAVHLSLYHEDTWHVPSFDHWAEREAKITKVTPAITPNAAVLDEWQRLNKGAHKVMCMGPVDEMDVLERDLNRNCSGDIHVYRSRPTYLELAPRRMSKGLGLELLLHEKFDFTVAEVLAFGDNYNDVDLLAMAGYGVAVANARDEVKAVAAEITAKSVDDGVALVVAREWRLV